MLQDDLAKQYKYKKLPDDVSESARAEYLRTLPSGFNIHGCDDQCLYSKSNTLIATGYDRIVIGDYGAFIEIDESQIVFGNFKIKEGEEYRIFDEKYSGNVKYHWYTPTDNSNMKIYYQKRTVVYADYQPNKFYISPFEVL